MSPAWHATEKYRTQKQICIFNWARIRKCLAKLSAYLHATNRDRVTLNSDANSLQKFTIRMLCYCNKIHDIIRKSNTFIRNTDYSLALTLLSPCFDRDISLHRRIKCVQFYGNDGAADDDDARHHSNGSKCAYNFNICKYSVSHKRKRTCRTMSIRRRLGFVSTSETQINVYGWHWPIDQWITIASQRVEHTISTHTHTATTE